LGKGKFGFGWGDGFLTTDGFPEGSVWGGGEKVRRKTKEKEVARCGRGAE